MPQNILKSTIRYGKMAENISGDLYQLNILVVEVIGGRGIIIWQALQTHSEVTLNPLRSVALGQVDSY